MKHVLAPLFIAGALVGIAVFVFAVIRPEKEYSLATASDTPEEKAKGLSVEERIRIAGEHSRNIKGLYMTADVASGEGPGPEHLRTQLIKIAEDTEINGLVIDVKEVCGPDYSEERLSALLKELHEKHIWAIARLTVFKDASQIETHPDWYLTRALAKPVQDQCFRKKYLREKNPGGKPGTTVFWRDDKGGYWMDPAHPVVYAYIVALGKKMIDLGFDELQFDYIRFPSDGDVAKASYPIWDGKTLKYVVLKRFFEYLNTNLKAYKPEIILSADMFGYAAVRHGDVGIGQRLDDIGVNFDYVSFMVYPSHYYSGFFMPANPGRKLPSVNLTLAESRGHPEIIVGRSIQFAKDFLEGRIATSTTSTSTQIVVGDTHPRSAAEQRPWLEDFFHDDDKAHGRPYGAQKVRLQIDAAEQAGASGWLLWNAANIYSVGALKKEE